MECGSWNRAQQRPESKPRQPTGPGRATVRRSTTLNKGRSRNPGNPTGPSRSSGTRKSSLNKGRSRNPGNPQSAPSSLRRTRSLNKGRSRNPGNPGVGPVALTEQYATLNKGRSRNPGNPGIGKRISRWLTHAQQRPESKPRQPPPWRRWGPGSQWTALNKGRSRNPGNPELAEPLLHALLVRSTKAGVETPATQRPVCNNCGDTAVAQQRPESKPRQPQLAGWLLPVGDSALNKGRSRNPGNP